MLGYGSRMTPVNGSVLRAPHAIPGGSAAKTRWGFVWSESTDGSGSGWRPPRSKKWRPPRSKKRTSPGQQGHLLPDTPPVYLSRRKD